MRLPKFKDGELYSVEFWDHSSHGKGVSYSDAVGYFYEQDDLHVCLLYWRAFNSGPGSDLDEDNIERANILKSAITKVKKL